MLVLYQGDFASPLWCCRGVVRLSANVDAAIVFEDDFTGPGGSVEGRSTDGSTAGVNGTYFNDNADIVYTDGVSGMTGVNPATQMGNFGTAAIDIVAGGNLDTTNSIVTSTMQINSNRTDDGGNGDNFGTVFVQYDNLAFQGLNNLSSGPAFAFQSLGAPFLLYKPGLSFDVFVSSDTGNGTPAFLEASNTIELIYNTATLDRSSDTTGHWCTLLHLSQQMLQNRSSGTILRSTRFSSSSITRTGLLIPFRST